jgi:hypothetical protein
MKINKWTLGLAAAGVVSLASAVQAEEATETVKTMVSSTTISGYVSTTASWKLGSGTGIPALVRAYDGTAKQDGFSLDVINLTISKPVGDGDWASGYKAELLFGPDAGVFEGAVGGTGDAGVSIKQAYVALRAPVGNGLDIKLGVWDTIIGYEVFNAGDNPNYSRSMGYGFEPTTYTGVQAGYKFTDWLSGIVGVANAGHPTVNGATGVTPGGLVRVATLAGGAAESEKSYMAALTLTAPESFGWLKGSTLSAGIIDHATGGGPNDVVNIYVGGTMATPWESLKLGAAWDHVAVAGDGDFAAFWANSAALYTSWQASEKLKLNLRGEYVWADDGALAPAYVAGAGGQAQLISVTGTLDYALWENVISRLEVRWDHDVAGGPATKPFGVADNSALTLALNVIYKF